MKDTVRFDSVASRPKHGLAVVYDLEGFSQFFNQPDVQDYVPKFINIVSEAVSISLFGGDAYWLNRADKTVDPLNPPIHEKFLGDGALYLWLHSEQSPVDTEFVVGLCNNLWNLKIRFDRVVQRAYDELPVVDLPKRIRFGVARGTIYELRRRGTKQHEYIGFCLNLASRLQKYCPELGFIASARVGLPRAQLEAHKYTRVVAKSIKGFPREVVLVDSDEYEQLSDARRDELFESVERPA